MTLGDVPKIKSFKFFWILFLRMTLGDITIFGFCFRDLSIRVKKNFVALFYSYEVVRTPLTDILLVFVELLMPSGYEKGKNLKKRSPF